MWGKITIFASDMRFLGNIEAKADAKGRVFLPATFRKVLQAEGEERLVLRRDVYKKCLILYPWSVWNNRIDTLLSRVNEFDDESQMVFRQFVSAAEELTLDGNGRFLIPRRLLQAAGIDQSVHIIGVNNTIEIWSDAEYEATFFPDAEFATKLKAMMAPRS